MACIEVGGLSFEMRKRSQNTSWRLSTKKDDDAFGPHIILQDGLRVIYLSPNEEEIKSLKDWCDQYLNQS